MIVLESEEDVRRLVRAVLAEIGPTEIVREPMTAEQLAKATGQDASTIRRRVRAGKIKRVPHTGRILIPHAEALRIINGNP